MGGEYSLSVCPNYPLDGSEKLRLLSAAQDMIHALQANGQNYNPYDIHIFINDHVRCVSRHFKQSGPQAQPSLHRHTSVFSQLRVYFHPVAGSCFVPSLALGTGFTLILLTV